TLFRSHWQAFEFALDGDLEVMARHRLVVGERAHAEARNLLHAAQVGVEDAGHGAVACRHGVVGAGRGLLLELRHAAHFDGRFRAQVEGIIQARADREIGRAYVWTPVT